METRKNNKNVFAFEGVDGCGKTTVIRYIKRILEKKGYRVIIISELGKNSSINLGWRIKFLKKRFGHGSKHAYKDLKKVIKIRKLVWKKAFRLQNKKNTIVLYDRFFFSTLSHQFYDLDVLEKLKRQCLHKFLYPYLRYVDVFYINATPENIIKRNIERQKGGNIDSRDPIELREVFNAERRYKKYSHMISLKKFDNNNLKELAFISKEISNIIY